MPKTPGSLVERSSPEPAARSIFSSSSRDEGLPERDGGDEFVEGEGELGDGEEVVLVLEQAVDHGLGHQLELEDGRVDAGALAGADLAACKSYSK